MDPNGKVCAVTGAASGIGKALVSELLRVGASHVAMIDLDDDGLRLTRAEIDPESQSTSLHPTDVRIESELVGAIDEIESTVGAISIFFSNAGISRSGGVEAPDEFWLDSWNVNLMPHVWAARKLVPLMEARGGGHLIQTASAAGLLTVLGAAPYAVSKHAAVALSEWMAITYRPRGIEVSCLCPQGVRTPMLFPELKRGAEQQGTIAEDVLAQSAVTVAGDVREPEEVARVTISAVKEGRFLILPHPEVSDYLKGMSNDVDGWISRMSRLSERISST